MISRLTPTSSFSFTITHHTLLLTRFISSSPSPLLHDVKQTWLKRADWPYTHKMIPRLTPTSSASSLTVTVLGLAVVFHRLYQHASLSGWGTTTGGTSRFFATTSTSSASASKHDAFEHLEEVASDSSMSWVREQNAKTLERLSAPEKDERYARILAALDSQEKIPYVQKRGPNRFYNFWKDEKHPRGLWRRLSDLTDLKNKEFKGWEVVLDLDAVDEKEGKPGWVWKGCTTLNEMPKTPHVRLALLKLSRGGADAVEIREFDLDKKAFIPGSQNGFFVKEAKTSVSYKDENTLLIGSDFGEGSLTDSGYPRVIKEWKRGTKLEDAPVVFEGEKTDVSVSSWYEPDNRGRVYEWRVRSKTFYTSEWRVRRVLGGSSSSPFVTLVDVPDDAEISIFGADFVIQLRSEWRGFPAGSLIVTGVDAVLEHGGSFKDRPLSALFLPTPTSSLEYQVFGPNSILISINENVHNKLMCFRKRADSWQGVEVTSTHNIGEKVDVWAVDENAEPGAKEEEFWMTKTGYLTPTSLFLASGFDWEKKRFNNVQFMRSLPSVFKIEENNWEVTQHFTTSLDGTKVPYFQVSRKDGNIMKKKKTLLYAYGGFEISLTPSYSMVTGIGWIERGNTYVVANIRGGGEYGPKWHQAALKEKRHKAFEDLDAVAGDLITRGVCARESLGVMGGSNGGLLVGNAFVRQATVNSKRPLYGAVVCEVPLLDMLRFHKLLAGSSWKGEYGDPDIPSEAAFLRKYSPYHVLDDRIFSTSTGAPARREEIEAKTSMLPSILLMTSTRDDRVHPGHARKFFAKLKSRKETEKKALYYENVEGGHAGAADNKQTAFMETLGFLFLESALKDY